MIICVNLLGIGIVTNSFIYNNKHLDCIIRKFIADCPAKSYCIQVKNHTGYYSCSKCQTEGEHVSNRMCFPDTEALPLTNEDFFQYVDDFYHIGIFPLVKIPNFDFVNYNPVE